MTFVDTSTEKVRLDVSRSLSQIHIAVKVGKLFGVRRRRMMSNEKKLKTRES